MTTAKEMIKVLFLCSAPKVLGGVETALMTLFQRLDRSRFEPVFVVAGFGPFYEKLVEIGANPVAFHCEGRYSMAWHAFLADHLRSHHYDVVHATVPTPNLWLLRRHGLKVVGRLNYPRMKHAWYPMRLTILDRFVSRFVDAYVAVSKSIVQQFTQRGYAPEKIHLIYNGVDRAPDGFGSTLRKELNIPDNHLVVGTLGRMRYEKGHDLFVKVAANLAAQYPLLTFVVAGDGDHRSECEALARSLGVADRIRFLGYRKDPRNVLKGFDILLYLSRWEAFSNTIIEAMSLGVAVVTTAVGGNVESVENEVNGLLVPPEDCLAATKAASGLLRDSKKRADLIAQARLSVEEFSAETMVRKHEALFAALAKGQGN